MLQEGLGECAEFYGYHPIVSFTYFFLVVGITMFSIHPVFLLLSFVGGWGYSLLLGGIKALKFNVRITIPVVLLVVAINTFSAHDGNTVLFYLNENRITAEAMIYGLAAALLLINVIVWFRNFQVIMTADKFIYLFGRVAPVLALLLSMIFRFIPLFRTRFREIRNGQQCMGRELHTGSLFGRGHQLLKEISILIAWSLECSIETSDSMEARGYGLKGRTSFHLYHFTKRDGGALAVMVLFGGVAIVGCVMGKTSMYYYPTFRIPWDGIWYSIIAISYMLLMTIPMVIDIKGENRWKQLNFEN